MPIKISNLAAKNEIYSISIEPRYAVLFTVHTAACS